MDANQNAPAEPATITPGPFSEQELREAWNSQADQYNQWDELDSCEQLAIAQTRAIAADRARRAAPAEPPAFALQWSENKPPGEECRYDHCEAQTPFGNFLITWKSWKPYDSPTVDETPWGDSWQAFATVELAKAACQREFDAKICQLWIEAYKTSPDAARATQLQEAWGDMAPANAVAGLAQLADKLREKPGQLSPPAEGAAWQAAATLRRLAAQNPMGVASRSIISAAELLERLAGELAMLRQQAAPVPVSERLPDTSDPSECWMPSGECWWFDPHQDGAWYMDTYQSCYTHWLPAHVLPLPWVKPPMADATADTAAALLQQQAAELDVLRQVARPVAIPGEAYDDDMGPVTWWRFPVEEAPWVGTPGDSDWPGYHTHFTACPPLPTAPEERPHA